MGAELFGQYFQNRDGVSQETVGRIASVEGGTVYLTGIDVLPLSIQTQFLRFLESDEITPAGGTQSRKVDVRVIVATHRDLGSLCESGEFRTDLYYRLNVVPLEMPPLTTIERNPNCEGNMNTTERDLRSRVLRRHATRSSSTYCSSLQQYPLQLALHL